MGARANSESGFTLIELMMVLVLIGIFSGLMFAEMRGTYEEALLRTTARKIISAASAASSKAITLNRPHSLLLDPQANLLRIQVGRGNGDGEVEHLDARILVTLQELPSASEDDADEGGGGREQPGDLRKIDFLPDGTASGREITLRDRMGVELILRVNPATGRIRILGSEVPR